MELVVLENTCSATGGESRQFGFIGVYPNGLENSWNIGREESVLADDVAFTESILSALGGIDGVTTARPVAMVFQWPAMVHKLAMYLSHLLGRLYPKNGIDHC